MFNKVTNTTFIRCKKCGKEMNSIHSDEVRDTCEECGGVAKFMYDRLLVVDWKRQCQNTDST